MSAVKDDDREAGIAELTEMLLKDEAPLVIQHEFDDQLLCDINGRLRTLLQAIDSSSAVSEATLAIRYLRRNLAMEVARERFDCYVQICADAGGDE